MNPVDGHLLLEHLMNVNFTTDQGERVYFDEHGDPPGRYDILNYQRLSGSGYGYVRIGTWDSGDLIINASRLIWSEERNKSLPESVCSKPCPRGQVKTIQDGGVACCWVCTECDEYEYLLDEYTCQACPRGWWPNTNLTGQ
ncbi:PREDICTED: metabotropic glutamate receptor 5-like [Priapulus caudatus]|uniref:Metabotropic glutamate receptor 5-like n=1 Tax=Priapulus caudatus TaxID=37621 RepID=A0ABM1F1H9_PRICU|nr:PREDICTED: metabotropic glutamate receptor 5-like [Priapulus caudatus]